MVVVLLQQTSCCHFLHVLGGMNVQVQPYLVHQHAGISSSSPDRGPSPSTATAAPQTLPPELDFTDSSQVFSMRSTGELLRMYAVLKVRRSTCC